MVDAVLKRKKDVVVVVVVVVIVKVVIEVSGAPSSPLSSSLPSQCLVCIIGLAVQCLGGHASRLAVGRF